MGEMADFRQNMLRTTFELLSNCKYCAMISKDPDDKTPIACTKLSGSPSPISVNIATCLTCGEYRKGFPQSQFHAS